VRGTFLNQNNIVPSDTQEVQSGEENTITAAEVFLAAKTLNVGKGRRQVVMKSDLKSSKP